MKPVSFCMTMVVGIFLGLVLLGIFSASSRQATFDYRFAQYVDCYADEMLLTPRWHIGLKYLVPDSTRGVYAETEADPAYLSATIWVDTAAMTADGLSDEEVRQTAVHELSHVWLWESAAIGQKYEDGLRVEERTVSGVSRWPLWLGLCQ